MQHRSSSAPWGVIVVALTASLSTPACAKKDGAIRKEIVGVWEGNPRLGLPREKIDETAFVTPDLDAIELEKTTVEDNGAERGWYTHVVHRPTSAVVPSLGRTLPERWEKKRGHWWVLGGEVHLVGEEPNREDIVLVYTDGKLVSRYYFGPKEGNDFTYARGRALPAVPANTP